MAGSKVGGKRKRQQSLSEQDKFVHKSGVLLQREAKKVRAFQVRKVVQQLKQSRAQLETAQREHQELLGKQRKGDDKDGVKQSDALCKKDKQGKKLQTTVNKLEKELVVLKALDLKAVVARAMETTGLEKKKQLEQQKKLRKQQEEQQQSRYGGEVDSDDESDYGRGGASGDEDDGFDSEEYENARKAGGAGGGRKDDSGSDSESDNESGEQEEQETGNEGAAEPMEQSEEPTTEQLKVPDMAEESNDVKDQSERNGAQEEKPSEEKEETGKAEQNADLQLQNMLIDRILAHKQMKPLLDAIGKVLEKEEREDEKKLRKQEKKALKRDRNEVLIGGRSSAAPTSLFLGSLSGRGGALDDDVDMAGGGIGMSSNYMDGAEDDIAEFLGEKKKKNRMGQNARRQKAIRMEESAKRKQDRENGIFRPFAPRKEDALSKYGPSERPKKKKPAAEAQGKNSKGGRSSNKPEKDQRRGGAGAGGSGRERERERGAPPSRAAAGATSSSTVRRPPPVNAPPVEPSHPSWIAKQALKEKEKASISAFSGKKITFGDD